MYIVTSKPKRISEYSGVVHMINYLIKLILKILTEMFFGFHDSHYTDIIKIQLAEKT